MIGDLKEVDFAAYCQKCENKKLSESESPCDECLDTPARQDSHKPLYFKEATNEKSNRSNKEQSSSK